MRNLAQRSAAAAKEIKTLIGDSVEKVDAGGKLVDEAGATMEEVVDSDRRVADIMADIAAASLEQTAGIEQVNEAIGQMDQVTQQNAALVEEAAAAAGSLQEQAASLASIVSVFTLDRAAAPVRLSAPVTRRIGQPRLAAAGADHWDNSTHGRAFAVDEAGKGKWWCANAATSSPKRRCQPRIERVESNAVKGRRRSLVSCRRRRCPPHKERTCACVAFRTPAGREQRGLDRPLDSRALSSMWSTSPAQRRAQTHAGAAASGVPDTPPWRAD